MKQTTGTRQVVVSSLKPKYGVRSFCTIASHWAKRKERKLCFENAYPVFNGVRVRNSLVQLAHDAKLDTLLETSLFETPTKSVYVFLIRQKGQD